ncbi:MAG: hypothetical protein JWM09_1059 [Francisellaceae bacterium]|nr:hypothetical protein [Francisellaceae bacterium]
MSNELKNEGAKITDTISVLKSLFKNKSPAVSAPIIFIFYLIPIWLLYHIPHRSASYHSEFFNYDEYISSFKSMEIFIQIYFFVISILPLYLCFKYLMYSYDIINFPTSKIRSATQGYVELNGLPQPYDSKPLISKLSKQECVWYRYSISDISRRNRAVIPFWVVEEGASQEPFWIKDETDLCLIHPENAKIISQKKTIWYAEDKNPDNMQTKRTLKNMNYMFIEELIYSNIPINAMGMFHTIYPQFTKGDQQKTDVNNLLVNWKADYKNALERFDTNKDGIISAEEWEVAIKTAEAEIKNKYSSNDINTKPINILTNEGLPKNKPFIISQMPKQKLIRDFQYSCIGYGLAFLALTSLWTLMDYYPAFVKMIIHH